MTVPDRAAARRVRRYVKQREWFDPSVRSARTPLEHFEAVCRFYDRQRGQDGIPQTPYQCWFQAKAIAGKDRYALVADRADEFAERALCSTVSLYDQAKGSFINLFILNYETMLMRALKRAIKRRVKRAEAIRKLMEQDEASERFGNVDVVALRQWRTTAESGFEYWARLLLRVARARLDPAAQAYLDRHLTVGRARPKFCDLPSRVGVSRATLWRRWKTYENGGIERQLRETVNRMVAELPVDHRQLLVHHLLNDAGLTPAEAEQLLGVPNVVEDGVRGVEEDELLRLLGWYDVVHGAPLRKSA